MMNFIREDILKAFLEQETNSAAAVQELKEEPVAFEVKEQETDIRDFDTHRALKEAFILQEDDITVKKEYIDEDLNPDIREALSKEAERKKFGTLPAMLTGFLGGTKETL